MGLIELGEVMMTRSERHLDLTSQNITNASTPGYKRHVSFDASIDDSHSADQTRANVATRPDLQQGALHQTGRPLDLAISGAGFFMVRGADGRLFYTRNGQFSRDNEGRAISTEGYALQAAGGGDIVLTSDAAEIQ